MAVLITKTGSNEEGLPLFTAFDQETGLEVIAKNWYEKSKDKYHIVLGANSANRKYIAHNEFETKAVDDEYLVEDKVGGPRVLGTSNPDKALIPFMTEEDLEIYNGIIERAKENKNSQKKVELTEEEKIEAQIKKLQEKLAMKKETI